MLVIPLDYPELQLCKIANTVCQYAICYIFSRPVEYIRGFTREVIIEITANIESQELRRCQSNEIGYPEHPRAGSTEDLECFFGVAHSRLGNVFTLKEFKDGWPKLVR